MFTIYEEEELTSDTISEIAILLQESYGHRKNSIQGKHFGRRLPLRRILYREAGELIGHTALFEDKTFIEGGTLTIGGIGLTCSRKRNQGIGHLLRDKARNFIRGEYPFAVGRVENTTRTRKNIGDLVVEFIEIPLVGKTTYSRDFEMLAIYNTGSTIEELQKYLAYFKKQGEMRITGEVF
jgi:hypothetical protein